MGKGILSPSSRDIGHLPSGNDLPLPSIALSLIPRPRTHKPCTPASGSSRLVPTSIAHRMDQYPWHEVMGTLGAPGAAEIAATCAVRFVDTTLSAYQSHTFHISEPPSADGL